MRHLSLCTGYGGIDMALAEVFGAETVAVADIDKGACKILAHRYPNVPNLGDITATDWSQWVGKVDVISGGTPCQDLSHAGRRAGMTEGTRSNLWVAMRESIATIRPVLVVWENVRGAYSAAADSDLEPCAGCVGDGSGVHLRALGRVLGDLSSLGYDACWYGLRASDVGAAHHRYRVFVFAWDATNPDAFRGRLDGRASDAQRRPELGTVVAGSGEVPGRMMPTPTAERDGNTPETHLARKPGRTVVTSLDVVAAHMLPTPVVNDMGDGKTPEWWADFTARSKANTGNGNGHGKSLAMEAQLLPSPRTSDTNGAGAHGDGGPDLRTVVSTMPTPRATDGTKGGPNQRGSSGDLMLPSAVQDWREYEPAIRRQEAAFGRPAPLPTEVSPASKRKCPIHGINAEGRPGEELRDVREAVDSQEVCERTTGRSQRVPEASTLLPELREHAEECDAIGARVPSEAVPEAGVRGMRGESVVKRKTAACPSQRPELGERRSEQSDDAVRVVPSETALAGGSRAALSDEPVACTCKHRLSAEFSSWLMGCPDGWITDTPGITRNEALKAAGNGVVPQQCAAAAQRFLRDLKALERAA